MNQLPSSSENFLVLWTIGHSNLEFEQFVELLKQYPIDTLVDIRSLPYSSRHPHFNRENLQPGLEQHGLQYHWAGRQLGGMRKPRKNSRHFALGGWQHAYADHMDTIDFKIGASQLTRLAERQNIVLMCAEKSYLSCHRKYLSDYLTAYGCRIFHVKDSTSVFEHKFSEHLRIEAGELVYDRGVLQDLH